jgi:hypothetical protein
MYFFDLPGDDGKSKLPIRQRRREDGPPAGLSFFS